jgi:hypothetical protein
MIERDSHKIAALCLLREWRLAMRSSFLWRLSLEVKIAWFEDLVRVGSVSLLNKSVMRSALVWWWAIQCQEHVQGVLIHQWAVPSRASSGDLWRGRAILLTPRERPMKSVFQIINGASKELDLCCQLINLTAQEFIILSLRTWQAAAAAPGDTATDITQELRMIALEERMLKL